MTYPDGFEVQYGYDALNRVVSAHEGDDLTANHVQGRLLASVSYDALSRRTGLTYANGDMRSFEYSTRGDLTGLDVLLGSAAVPATRSFGWAFTHNGVGQVLSNTLDSEPGLWWSPPESKVESYASNGLNQYDGKTADDGSSTSFVYDGNGNMVVGPVPGTFNYTAENELRNIWGNPVGTINYRYFPNGTRKSKTVNGATTSFWYWGDQEIMETDTGAINHTPIVLRRYVRLPGSVDEAFLMFDYSGAQIEEHWVHTDRLGSTVMTTDEAGTVRERFSYDPYGNSGGTTTGFPFRFTGQKLDPETGLMYYKARYYSSDIGRFLQVDPIGYEDQQNLYAYTYNDPLNFKDPTGKCPMCVAAVIGGGVGAIVGAASDVATKVVTGRADEITVSSVTSAAVGGLVTGAVIGGTGNVALGTTLGSAAGSITGQVIDNQSVDVSQTIGDTLVGAVTSKIPGVRVKGITSGRNSMLAKYKSQLTGLRNGTRGVTDNTFDISLKGGAASAVGSSGDAVIGSILDAAGVNDLVGTAIEEVPETALEYALGAEPAESTCNVICF